MLARYRQRQNHSLSDEPSPMPFPHDILVCMRSCVLSVIWPKKDIVTLFQRCGCTAADLKSVQNFKEDNLSRTAIVDKVFEALEKRNDEGIGQFRALMQVLIDWSTFDSYYFDELKKLDRAAAERNLTHLRQLQELRDAKIKQQKADAARAEQASSEIRRTIAETKSKFLSLFGSADTQRRGYDFEAVLRELARSSGLEVTDAFRTTGEQIDGAVKYEGEHYLVEAKWRDKQSCNEPLYQFAMKVEGKMYGRGIFVSINGFSEEAVKSLLKGKALRTILVDGGDITYVVEEYLSFASMIDRKVKAAQTRGEIYVDPMTGKPKVSI